MDVADIRAQLELELAWRQDELRFLRNQLTYIFKESDKDCYRKSLVVMLYSHFEGFCKEAFSIYVESINKEKLLCYEAHDCIVAASLSDVFKALENTDKKCQVFKNSLPDDTKLHRFSRQVDFVSKLNNFWNQQIYIPVDSVVDVESNLKPIVLRKILFRLGFSHEEFKTYEGKIDKLLNYRNNIAHGTEKSGLREKEYEDVEKAVYEVMDALIKILMHALRERVYKKP